MEKYTTESLHCSSFLGLPFRILNIELVKPKKRNYNGEYRYSNRGQAMRPRDFPSYGWDNEYGHRSVQAISGFFGGLGFGGAGVFRTL